MKNTMKMVKDTLHLKNGKKNFIIGTALMLLLPCTGIGESIIAIGIGDLVDDHEAKEKLKKMYEESDKEVEKILEERKVESSEEVVVTTEDVDTESKEEEA